MKRYYSKTTQTTYVSGIHAAMPEDAVEISELRYQEVIANPAAGKVRGHDDKGLPILVDPLPPTVEDLSVQERQWRDSEVERIKWLRERHRDQLEIEGPTTLTAEQFSELLIYMQALRDWPQSSDFPDSQHRPTAPGWIAEEVQ
jgi:hypothetical protein